MIIGGIDDKIVMLLLLFFIGYMVIGKEGFSVGATYKNIDFYNWAYINYQSITHKKCIDDFNEKYDNIKVGAGPGNFDLVGDMQDCGGNYEIFTQYYKDDNVDGGYQMCARYPAVGKTLKKYLETIPGSNFINDFERCLSYLPECVEDPDTKGYTGWLDPNICRCPPNSVLKESSGQYRCELGNEFI